MEIIVNKKELPQIGKTYFCYDDGKISLSRQYEVIVTNIIKFDKIAYRLAEIIRIAQKDFEVYAQETDYVICGVSNEEPDFPKMSYFIRTKDGDWFSIGKLTNNEEYPLDIMFCSGRLDVDNSLTNFLIENVF